MEFETPVTVPTLSTELLATADGELNRELHSFLFDPPETRELLKGPWVLINANLVKGRKATGIWNIHADLQNAGGTVIDEPVVVDGNLVTARFPYTCRA